MDYFAGLDVSVKETSICIVDETGKIVREVASEPQALLAVLKNPAYHFKRIGLEAGRSAARLRRSSFPTGFQWRRPLSSLTTVRHRPAWDHAARGKSLIPRSPGTWPGTCRGLFDAGHRRVLGPRSGFCPYGTLPRPPCIKATRFPQEKVFQDELPFAGNERPVADPACYFQLDRLGPARALTTW